MRARPLRSLGCPSVETAAPGWKAQAAARLAPSPSAIDAELGEVQLAAVVAVDQEEVGGLEVLDEPRALAAGQGAAGVLALAAEVQAEHGVVEPLEVLGQALALELGTPGPRSPCATGPTRGSA